MWGKLRPVGSRIPVAHKILSTGQFPWHQNYRAEFTASGTQALAMAVAFAASRKKSVSAPEIIIPAYGCPDLVAAIIAGGGKPVLVDLKPGTGFMNESQLRGAVTTRTVAVVAVALLGTPERLDILSKICRELRLFLIEDAAQCFPPASTESAWADAVILSFGRGKPINLMGGGALLVRNEIYEESKSVIDQFPRMEARLGLVWRLKRRLFHLLMARIPYLVLEKLPFFGIGDTKYHKCSAVIRLALPESLVHAGIDDFRARPLVYPLYDRELKGLERSGWTILGDSSRSPNLPRIRYGLLAPTQRLRDEALLALNNSGIGASRFYGQALPGIEGLKEICGPARFPVAEDFAARLLTLPCHEDVQAEDVALVARILKGQSSH
ncbi:DegT/DnrJ/EryC1/StrS family aminotransferase [Marinobacter arenosus]|uniref:DegT/DnrJ/EryC1/StrS family aminotransferase n=1 Tax=Marinobacter arenosus TaxID=2856822 RepID=UPI001C4BD6C3|nr:DegT/DnrJ/EryC1/StrS family aminotransferase [Marinobacter arenosus]MBW0146433.1 DegT/DnrJ/EryC1/StrS family aminotransferase [Marinobacter arenosus]